MPMENDLNIAAGPEHISHFLALPRELRDDVYHLLLNEHWPAPEDPSHARNRDANPSTTYFQPQSPKPALLQLKLCSKQTYAEVTDMIDLYETQLSNKAHLDIMVKGSVIIPTWTFLPLASSIDPTIDVSLRLFEAAGWGSEFSTSAYRSLWSFFCNLVFQGPCFRPSHSTRSLATPLQIGCIRFDIRLCFPTSVDDLFGTYRDVFDRLERLAMDNVGLGHVGMVEACFGVDCRAWRLKQLPTGLTFASRV